MGLWATGHQYPRKLEVHWVCQIIGANIIAKLGAYDPRARAGLVLVLVLVLLLLLLDKLRDTQVCAFQEGCLRVDPSAPLRSALATLPGFPSPPQACLKPASSN